MNKKTVKLIEDKLQDIQKRLEHLIMAKETYQNRIKEVDIQITQLLGAANEIGSLLPKDE